MIQSISETVILPIAGIFLTFIACYELIQMVIDHNNLSNFDLELLQMGIQDLCGRDAHHQHL